MQDPTSVAAFAVQQQVVKGAQFPEQELPQLRCPRCDSTNTKFCYYNNYNLSQPRHFCKSCRRYWTRGGALRNIPVGGGSRKNSKRPSSAAGVATQENSAKRPAADPGLGLKPEPGLPVGGFSSLLASGGQFGSLLEGIGSGPDLGLELPVGRGGGGGGSVEGMLGLGELQNGAETGGCWGGSGGGGGGWSDLAIFTPGTRFQ